MSRQSSWFRIFTVCTFENFQVHWPIRGVIDITVRVCYYGRGKVFINTRIVFPQFFVANYDGSEVGTLDKKST